MSKQNLILKEAGLKATPTRLTILAMFGKHCKPMNAEHIFAVLKAKKVNLVTIYRTLDSFSRAGILNRVDLHKESAFYELADHHHHHIVCTDCGVVESFEDCDVKRLSRNALAHSSKFKAVDTHSLEFFGVCKACSKE